jgi:hypothetical protein
MVRSRQVAKVSFQKIAEKIEFLQTKSDSRVKSENEQFATSKVVEAGVAQWQ